MKTPDQMETLIDLTPEEAKAIRAFERAMKKMPKTLHIFGGTDFISIRKGGESLQYEVAYIPGYVSGGDGGDKF